MQLSALQRFANFRAFEFHTPSNIETLQPWNLESLWPSKHPAFRLFFAAWTLRPFTCWHVEPTPLCFSSLAGSWKLATPQPLSDCQPDFLWTPCTACMGERAGGLSGGVFWIWIVWDKAVWGPGGFGNQYLNTNSSKPLALSIEICLGQVGLGIHFLHFSTPIGSTSQW